MTKPAPWLEGVIDTLAGAAILRESSLPTRNRLAVILIDSAFETACRAYLRHIARIKIEDAHKRRENLVSAVRNKLAEIDEDVWSSINYYYEDVRNDFYHQSAGKTLTDVAVLDYLDTVEFVIDTGLSVKIGILVNERVAVVKAAITSLIPLPAPPPIPLTLLSSDVDKIIVAVAAMSPKAVGDLNDFFKKAGDKLRLKPAAFTTILGRNSGSKKFFFFNRQTKAWQLSELGTFKLEQLRSQS